MAGGLYSWPALPGCAFVSSWLPSCCQPMPLGQRMRLWQDGHSRAARSRHAYRPEGGDRGRGRSDCIPRKDGNCSGCWMLAVGVAGFVLGVSRQRQQAAHNYRLALSPLLHRPGRLGSPDPIPKLNLHAPERLDTYRCRGERESLPSCLPRALERDGHAHLPRLAHTRRCTFYRNRQQ